MATPVGHSLAGYAIARLGAERGHMDRALAVLCVGLALSPDLDFLPGILRGQPAFYHQTVSHSLTFALVASGIAAVGLHWKGRKLIRSWVVLFFAGASHLVIDLFAPDGRPPYGVPVAWPVLDVYYLAPLELFPGVRHASGTTTSTYEWVNAILDWHNVRAIVIESAILAPLVVIAELRHRRVGLRR